MGVTSLMDLISTPAACKARMADSRPEPGPLTRMSRERRPESLATVAAAEAGCWAAEGVPFHVRDGHVRVVEGGVDVGHAVDDVTLLLLGLLGARLLGRDGGSGGGNRLGHSIPSSTAWWGRRPWGG